MASTNYDAAKEAILFARFYVFGDIEGGSLVFLLT